MKTITAVYPQCVDCLYHFKSQSLLDMHVCDGKRESQDALSIATRHSNELLSKMDFSFDGAIAHASNMLVAEGSGDVPHATFEPSFYTGWAHTRKNTNPDLTTKVTNVIHECWKTGESKKLGNVKISADGVFVRLEEMQS